MRRAITLVLVLLLATSPVAAATLIHTDDTELGSGSTTNATVSGTGDSASVTWPTNVTTTLDGFEDGDLSEWGGDTDTFSASTAASHDGSYGLASTNNDGLIYSVNRQIHYRRYGGTSFWLNTNSNTDTEYNMDDVVNLSFVDGTVKYSDGSGYVDTGIDVTNGWHKVDISNIDYGADTATLTITNDNGGQEYQNTVPIDAAATGFDSIFIVKRNSGGDFQIDTIELEEPATSGSYTSAEYDVTNPTNGFVDIGTISNSEATVQWQYNTGSGWQTDTTNTYSTAGNKSVALSTNADRWRVQVDFANTSATDYYAEIAAEGVEFDDSAPSLSGASPTGGAQVSSSPVTLEIDVADGDFPTAQGDSVEVEFRDASDDSVIGTDTLTTNGTASTDWDDALAGQNDWYAVATDSYGQQTTSATHTFTTPSELAIRNETSPNQLINDSATVTVRFYSDDTVIERKTTDGTIDLSGLPQERLIAVVETDQYYTRRVVIDSLYEQSSVYLLNQTQTAVFNEFVTDDQTGTFDSETTRLYIEKAITRDGNTTWEVIAGDYLGASSTFPANLQRDARYRLSVENDEGDTRSLGAYTAAREGTVTLTIGNIDWQAPENETLRWEAYQENTTIHLQFEDATDQTSGWSVSVYERGNESNVIYQDTQTTLGSYDTTVQLTGDQTDKQWVVEWSATRNDEEIGATLPISGVNSLPLPVDDRWLTVGSLWLLVGFAALFPSTSARTGAVVIVAIAAGLSWMGWAPIPFVAVGLAGAIALLGKAADWRGGYA